MIGLDGKTPSSTAYQNAPLAVVGEWDDYHKVALRAETRQWDDRSWRSPSVLQPD